MAEGLVTRFDECHVNQLFVNNLVLKRTVFMFGAPSRCNNA